MLVLPTYKMEKNFRLGIIRDLTSLSFKALQIYKANSDSEDKYSENKQMIYLFLRELNILAQRTEAYEDLSVYQDNKETYSVSELSFNKHLLDSEKQPWIHILIKEQTYDSDPFSFFDQRQKSIRDLVPIDATNDEAHLNGYTPKFQILDTEKLLCN